jgi:hypothetical protein
MLMASSGEFEVWRGTLPSLPQASSFCALLPLDGLAWSLSLVSGLHLHAMWVNIRTLSVMLIAALAGSGSRAAKYARPVSRRSHERAIRWSCVH